jgi:hypothetical protein
MTDISPPPTPTPPLREDRLGSPTFYQGGGGGGVENPGLSRNMEMAGSTNPAMQGEGVKGWVGSGAVHAG